jgi:repressor LexA
MTKTEKETYDAIKDFIQTHGYSPTIRELCQITGKKSTSTISARLLNLQMKGYITTEEGKSRTIKILK